MDEMALYLCGLKKEEFVKKVYSLLQNAIGRLSNDNFLTITITPQKQELVSLRDAFLDLNENGIGIRIKFGIKRVEIKNADGVYELYDLEEEFMIDQVLAANNFQINRSIKLTESNGIVRDIKVNSFQISVYLGDNPVEKKTIIKIY